VKRFIRQYSENITGVISCFDRVLFKGYLPILFGMTFASRIFLRIGLASRGCVCHDCGHGVQG